jgi:N-acetylglucosamine kinase-like BadF-type ATPase
VLGVDAGGTKTICLLARAADGAIIGRGIGGRGTFARRARRAWRRSLAEAIGAAFGAAGIIGERGEIAAAVIGAAGAARDDDRAASRRSCAARSRRRAIASPTTRRSHCARALPTGPASC